MFVLRWGGWPSWTPLLLQTMRANPTVRFLILGDMQPAFPMQADSWPAHIEFHATSVKAVLRKVRMVLGEAPASSLSVAGGASKISDFKPMLAQLFPE